MTAYQVTARNFSSASENRIHSDEIAQKYGFTGALVPGVAVYGHTTYPMAADLGAAWLEHSVSSVRLHKPTYHGDQLTLQRTDDDTGAHVACHNSNGTLVASLDSTLTVPEPEHLALLDGEFKHPQRVEIAWDNVAPHAVFAPWTAELSPQECQRTASEVGDELSLYKDYAHPHLLLSLANTALMNEYVMPTWLHVGSETRHRAALRVGDEITVRSVVLDKWRKKGHEFIQVWVTYWRDEQLTTDILHTAIFKVAS